MKRTPDQNGFNKSRNSHHAQHRAILLKAKWTDAVKHKARLPAAPQCRHAGRYPAASETAHGDRWLERWLRIARAAVRVAMSPGVDSAVCPRQSDHSPEMCSEEG